MGVFLCEFESRHPHKGGTGAIRLHLFPFYTAPPFVGILNLSDASISIMVLSIRSGLSSCLSRDVFPVLACIDVLFRCPVDTSLHDTVRGLSAASALVTGLSSTSLPSWTCGITSSLFLDAVLAGVSVPLPLYIVHRMALGGTYPRLCLGPRYRAAASEAPVKGSAGTETPGDADMRSTAWRTGTDIVNMPLPRVQHGGTA